MIDKKLLIDLVSIQASSSDDKDINEFIMKMITKKGITVSKDAFGNMYAVKGTGKDGYKCIVAHTDTVHSMETDRKVYEHGDILFAMARAIPSVYSAPIKQVGINGDDFCGIYTCIKALQDFDDIKVVFFRFEETGCRGSNASNMKFFEDTNFIIQCDRRGSSDFITTTNGIKVASNEFTDTMKPIYTKYNYAECIGVSTDVGALKKRGLDVSAINLSCGYFAPHSNNEEINMKDLDNCYNLVSEMFKTHGSTRFEHKYVAPVHKSTYESYGPKIVSKRKKVNKYFSNTALINFFSPLKNEEEVNISTQSYVLFSRIGKTDSYNYIGDDYLSMDDKECNRCGAMGTVLFSIMDGSIYCSAHGCTGFIEDEDLFKSAIITDNDTEFVFDRVNAVWLMKSEAIWNDEIKSYTDKFDLIA